jgi:hypothetical protein
VIWRYDPILFSSATDAEFHCKTYQSISAALRGYTYRSVISIATIYRKIRGRLRELDKHCIKLTDCEGEHFDELMHSLAQTAHENDMEIVSCAQEHDLTPYGILPGKCVDDSLIERSFGITVEARKDPSQRKFCGCVVSKDIGMYDSCLFGCRYCYATTSFERAKINHKNHDPGSTSLLGCYNAQDEPIESFQ